MWIDDLNYHRVYFRALEICLSEVARCQFFIGMLGERYGWVPDKYVVPDTPQFDWVREYPAGASVTELEMYSAALCKPADAVGKAFFFFRDNSFAKYVNYIESSIHIKYALVLNIVFLGSF